MNSPILAWTKQFHSDSHDFSYAIAADPGGNVFLSGFTSGNVTEDGHKGSYDAFLARYNGRGDLVWVEQLGTAAKDEARGVAADRQGNAFLCGTTAGPLARGGHVGGNDAFVAKFNAKGKKEWVRQLGTSADDIATDVATDLAGNVVVCGATAGELEKGNYHGGWDAFVAKYDAKGDSLWVRQLGSARNERARAVTTDFEGNVLVCGYTTGDLEPGKQPGSEDIFLAKFSGRGDLRWLRQIGDVAAEHAYGIATDQFGNVLICGSGTSTDDSSNAGGFHSFLGKYDADGGERWTRNLQGGASQVAYAVATDPLGNAFVSGTLTDTMGRSRGYLAKFDADGAPVWRETIAPALRCQGYGLAADLYGNLYVSGFSTGELVAGREDRGWDAWLAKFMDDVSVPHHHLLVENRFAHLSDQLDRIELMMDLSDLDLGLLQSARANVKGRGESRISKAEAQELLDLAIDRETKTISLLRKKTLAFIYAKYNLTRGALELIEGAIAGKQSQ